MTTVMQPTHDQAVKRLCYYYDANIGNYYYGEGHVMKPQRIRMTHQLILNYGLYQHMSVFRPWPATFKEMTRFHTEEYANLLRTATPDTLDLYSQEQLERFNIGNDCPIFDGLFEFCARSTGGSLSGAVKLNKKNADIVINWMGGLHHAKKAEASGFCYTNDIVLGILELLKHHKRVLYVDIDVHHGDGVEEAFYTTDRVMTVSFHRHGQNYFPSTGDVKDIGQGEGRLYALNVPLKEGITDIQYQDIFQTVMKKVMERYQPEAVVLQCGADSITGDKLGDFNLTLHGHGDCVKFFRSYNIPLMMLGGGGYTPRNVARCWAYETALALNREVSNQLPYNDYIEYFQPDYQLHLVPAVMTNWNTTGSLRKIQAEVLRNLEELDIAPSVQMQPIPADALSCNDVSAALRDAANPDRRLNSSVMDDVTLDQGEFYDGEEGGDGRNVHNAKGDYSWSEEDYSL